MFPKQNSNDNQYDRSLIRLNFSDLDDGCDCIKKSNCPLCRTYLSVINKIQSKKIARKETAKNRVSYLEGGKK